MRKPKIVGLAGIDKGIKSLAGIGQNLNERVQDLAVAIIDHGANAGNGDMSRALTLVQTVNRMRSLNTAFLVGFLRYFGNCNVNLRANDGKGKVSLIARDAKAYRGFDVAGATANNWYEAFDEQGNRSNWYAGPQPAEFQPMTVGDIATRMSDFSKRTTKLLDDTKTVGGKDVPVVALTEQDRQQVSHALAFIDRIAATLARHETVAELTAKLAEEQGALEQDNEVVAVLNADKAVA
jgi:hypothetical protein